MSNDMIAIYLRDHSAVAAGGVALAQRAAANVGHWPRPRGRASPASSGIASTCSRQRSGAETSAPATRRAT